MDAYGYRRPTLPDGVAVADLTRSVAAGPVKEPGPDERVLCINRGQRTLTETVDARHVEIPPGLFEVEYAAAKHLQKKLIVPGSKNLETGGWVSFVGILGVNHEDQCQPFTPEELARMSERHEAIDRGALLSREDRDVSIVRTTSAVAASPSYGVGGGAPAIRRGIDVSAQATEAAREAADHVLDTPAESLTRQAEAEAGRGRRRR